MKNNKLYVDVYKLCKFMKKIAEYQQEKNLPRIRLSFNSADFPVIDREEEKKNNSYNFRVTHDLKLTLMSFCNGYIHFRQYDIGKPDDAIKINFILKKSNDDKIIIDKSNLLVSKMININIYIKENEFNYDDSLQIFICRFVTKNFRQLEMREYKPGFSKPINKDYQDIIKRESYTQEELLKLYPLPNLDD